MLLKKREKSRERGFGIEIPPVLCKRFVPKLQKAVLFATVRRFTLLLPLQPGFAKDTAFFFAKAQNSRIRHSPNSGTVCRFPVLPTPCAKTAKSCAFCDCTPVYSFAAFAIRFCQRHCVFLCKGTKAQEFGEAEFLGLFAGSRFGAQHAVPEFSVS